MEMGEDPRRRSGWMQKEYTQTKEQVLEGLRTDRQGLSAQEAEKRFGSTERIA